VKLVGRDFHGHDLYETKSSPIFAWEAQDVSGAEMSVSNYEVVIDQFIEMKKTSEMKQKLVMDAF